MNGVTAAKRARTLVVLCAFVSLNACTILSMTQPELDDLTRKFDSGSLSGKESKRIKNVYHDLIMGGTVAYPEAAKILKYYISEHKADLYMKSKRFFESKTVKALFVQPKKEIVGPVYVKISDDQRVAYAINGFFVNTVKREIYQRIDFAARSDRSVYTYFDLPNGRLKLPDRLIRVFEDEGGCAAFTVHITER